MFLFVWTDLKKNSEKTRAEIFPDFDKSYQKHETKLEQLALKLKPSNIQPSQSTIDGNNELILQIECKEKLRNLERVLHCVGVWCTYPEG